MAALQLRLVQQTNLSDPPARLSTPHHINLLTDPHEREPYNHRYLHTWTGQHVRRLMGAFAASVAREPLIPLGAPLDHVPAARR